MLEGRGIFKLVNSQHASFKKLPYEVKENEEQNNQTGECQLKEIPTHVIPISPYLCERDLVPCFPINMSKNLRYMFATPSQHYKDLIKVQNHLK